MANENETPASEVALAAAATPTAVAAAVDRLRVLRSELIGVLDEYAAASARRYEAAVHTAQRELARSLETGSHTDGTVALLALAYTAEQLRSDFHTAAVPVLARLDAAIEAVVPPDPDPEDTTPGAKRRRAAAAPSSVADLVVAARSDVQASTVRALCAEPSAFFGSSLSASEHRLLDTVITESAMLPDVSRLRGVQHPAACLYEHASDAEWPLARDAGPAGGAGVHLGFHAPTALMEFAVHRGRMRRFTVVHLLWRMGFGPADINRAGASYVDHSLYRRVLAEPRTAFLAESYAPRLLVFRGEAWCVLMDVFVRHHHLGGGGGTLDPRAWVRNLGAQAAADRILQELGGAHHPQQHRMPTTILAALHRCGGLGAEADPAMDRLPEIQADFLRGVRAMCGGALGSAMDAAAIGQTHVRAWPVCLRRAAREHVRALVRTLRFVPSTLHVVVRSRGRAAADEDPVCCLTDWLWERRSTEDDDDEGRCGLRIRVRETLVRDAPTVAPAGGGTGAAELDEVALVAAVEARVGPATDDDRRSVDEALANLERLVRAAADHGPARRWTARDVAVHGFRASEVLAALADECRCFSPAEYEDVARQRLERIAEDALVGSDSVCVEGDSGLRPRHLYTTAE